MQFRISRSILFLLFSLLEVEVFVEMYLCMQTGTTTIIRMCTIACCIEPFYKKRLHSLYTYTCLVYDIDRKPTVNEDKTRHSRLR